jgi:hypothetical protein
MYEDSVPYWLYPRRILVPFLRDVDELHLRYRAEDHCLAVKTTCASLLLAVRLTDRPPSKLFLPSLLTEHKRWTPGGRRDDEEWWGGDLRYVGYVFIDCILSCIDTLQEQGAWNICLARTNSSFLTDSSSGPTKYLHGDESFFRSQ